MTDAVCFKCGCMKFGAFIECKTCGVRPLSDEDLMFSIAMTDHYFDADDLRQMGDAIKSGETLNLDPETRKDLMVMVEQAKKTPLWKSLSQGAAAPAKTKSWWKFW